MVKVEKFYSDLLSMLDLKVASNGVIMTSINGVDNPILIDGLPLVLPTSENIKTAVELRDGKPTPVKYIFNPLNESAIKGENKSFSKLKTIMELKLLGVIFAVGETMFSFLSNKDTDINDIIISKFLTKLNKYKTSAVKQMIDPKTLSSWVDLYSNIVTKHDNEKYISLYIKRGGKIDGVKYNRLGVITFPFVEALDKHNTKDGKFLDVNLRNKDKNDFISLFEFIFGDKETLIKGKQYGSLNKLSPSTHVLLMMYDEIYKSLKDILESFSDMDIEADIKDMLELKPLPFNIVTLSDIIEDLNTDVKQVPSMDDVSSLQSAQQNIISNQQIAQPMANVNNNNKATPTIQQQAPVAEPTDPWDKLAAKQANNIQQQQPYCSPVQPVIPQQYPVNQPVANGMPIVNQVNPMAQQPVNMNMPMVNPMNQAYPMNQQMGNGMPIVNQINPMTQQMGNRNMPMGNAPRVMPVQSNMDPWR